MNAITSRHPKSRAKLDLGTDFSAEGSAQKGMIYFDPELGMVTLMEVSATIKVEMLGNKLPKTQKVSQKLISVEDIKE